MSAVPFTFTCTAADIAGSFWPCIATTTFAAFTRARTSSVRSNATRRRAAGRTVIASSGITQPFRTADAINRRSFPGVRGSICATVGTGGGVGFATPPNPPFNGLSSAGLIILHPRLSGANGSELHRPFPTGCRACRCLHFVRA